MHITHLMEPTLQSCLETKINLKENNFNFGSTIYLKSWADRLASKRHKQA